MAGRVGGRGGRGRGAGAPFPNGPVALDFDASNLPNLVYFYATSLEFPPRYFPSQSYPHAGGLTFS